MLHVLVCVSLFSLAGSNAIESSCYTKGECVNSPYVFLVETDVAKDCHDECLSSDDCGAFTWYSSTKYCQGFLECLEFSNSTCSDCLSGLRNCQEPICFVKGRCLGISLGIPHSETENECLHLCQSHPKCNWFTFDEKLHSCTLLDGCNEIDESCVSCQSGQISCEDKPELSKFMVIGGLSGERRIEIVDLKSIDTTCQKPGQFEFQQSPSFMYRGLVHACGGYINPRNCYYYDHANSAWTETTPMIEERRGFHVLQISYEEFWFLGGEDSAGVKDSTEILKDGSFHLGPTMPFKLVFYCAVKVNSSFVFIGGGKSFDHVTNATFKSNASFLIDLKSWEWIQLPPLNGPRNGLACGLFKDEDGNAFIVAAGGIGASGDRTDSEILDLRTLTWSPGPDLPHGVTFANLGVVQFRNDFIVTGGYDNFNSVGVFYGSMLKFDKTLQWHNLAQTILPRRAHSVILIPDEMANCN